MANLSICRVCLSADLKTHRIQNIQLQEIYEKLTNSKLIDDGKPQAVCYICLWQLQRCQKLQNKAEKSEDILTQLFQNGIEISQKTVAVLNKGIQHNFSTTSIAVLSYHCANGAVKDEPVDVKQESIEQYSEVATCETAVCRVCLSGHHRSRAITNTALQDIYERLTNFKLITADCRPTLTCHICRATLQRCRALVKKAIKADRILAELGHNNIELTQETASLLNRRIKPTLTMRPVELNTYYADNVLVKEEIENAHENEIDSSFQLEIPMKNELEAEIAYNGVIVKSEEYGYIIQTGDMETSTYSRQKLFRQRKIVQVHSCDLCTYQCFDKIKLENHKKFHDQNREYACPICKYRYKTHNALHSHKKRMHSIKHHCTICDQTFARKVEFKMHQLLHVEKKTYNCERCHIIYKRRSYLVNHISKIHPEERYPCERCNKVYTKRQWLRDHMFRIHAPQSRRYICDICHKDYARKSILKLHISNTHDQIKPYKCSECLKAFSIKQNLTTHMSLHTGEKPYECDMCNKKFREPLFLRKHKETHGEKLVPCHICDKKFLRQSTLKDHVMRIHTKDRPFGCDKCDASFVNGFVLRNHMTTHSNARPYSCMRCRSKFKTKCSLRNHNALFHSSKEPKMFICDLCKKVFNKKANLMTHLDFHYGRKIYRCDFCKKKFRLKTALIVHRRTHTGEKPFSCHVCEKRFSQTSSLQRHIKVHTREKPYICRKCNKSYPDKGSLRHHEAYIHNEATKYICDLCNKVFINKAVISNHLRRHDKKYPYACGKCKMAFNKLSKLTLHANVHEKTYACSFCAKMFDKKNSLVRHNIIAHAGVRSLGCNVCGETFDQLMRLNAHMRRHTGEKPFACDICDRPYVERRDLQQHMKSKHNKVLVFR